MSDTRTLLDKLRDMASQDGSPHEAAIAAAKLETMGAGDRLPPRRPPMAPAPGSPSHSNHSTTSTTNSSATWTVTFNTVVS